MIPKNRHILHILNTPNNLIFNLTDFTGKTKFVYSAKAARYKSKQVRSTIVIQTLWKTIFDKLKNNNCYNLSLKFKGLAFQKKNLIKQLTEQGFLIISIELVTPIYFNGCKTRHFRRV